MIKDKSVEEITELWVEYHKQKDCIAAAIPVEQYDTMFERFKTHPLFIFALPRTQGYEFIMLQFSFPNQSIHFTPLLCYQVCHISCLENFFFHILCSHRYTKRMRQNV